jgi:hypothetical protein
MKRKTSEACFACSLTDPSKEPHTYLGKTGTTVFRLSLDRSYFGEVLAIYHEHEDTRSWVLNVHEEQRSTYDSDVRAAGRAVLEALKPQYILTADLWEKHKVVRVCPRRASDPDAGCGIAPSKEDYEALREAEYSILIDTLKPHFSRLASPARNPHDERNLSRHFPKK